MFKEYTVNNIIDEIIDYRGKTPKKLGGNWSEVPTEYMALSAKNIKNGRIVQTDSIRFVSESMYKKWMKQEVDRGTILITSEAPFGELLYWDSDEKIVLSQRLFGLKIKKEFNARYIYYYMLSHTFQSELCGRATGSTVTGLRQPELLKCSIKIPTREIQDKIASILTRIDTKINLNININNNLSEQIKCIYNEMFTEYDNYKRLSEISNITIGKTPPRSESEFFTTDEKDIKWISISDIGKAGMFIFDTSERLTQDAIAKYNIKIIPKNTVILSFKLTIGRTGFTTENMATNEAIAHFDLFDKNLNNYLYCTLTYFNYSDLGSTSSIATAINSKIVKSIKIGIPNEKLLNKFNDLTSAMFKIIKNNEYENIKLSELRDILLPKLMNGEIDLDNIEI